MIFLCLLPSPISLFQYLNITRRTIFKSILVAREHMAMYQPKESQVRKDQEARALASKRPHHLYDRFSQGIVSLDKLGEDSKTIMPLYLVRQLHMGVIS